MLTTVVLSVLGIFQEGYQIWRERLIGWDVDDPRA
jgi:hypothetical protein